MPPDKIAPMAAVPAEALESFSDLELLVLRYAHDLWMRPEQRIPRYDWHYFGFICGRGWGKTEAIGCEINRRVECGEARHIGLMAPNDDRVDEVQFTTLIETSKPWFRPERYRRGLRWPNGVTAIGFTPLAPGRPRSENLDLTWLTEIVDWNESSRVEAFNNITTATRLGRSQVIWDTTAKGRNDVIMFLENLNGINARMYPIQRGSMFDNPMLTGKYLRTELRKYTGRRREEEIEGKSFRESEGALWAQDWIDRHRVTERPANPAITLVSVDPALSAGPDSDPFGIVIGSRGRDGHAYVFEDLSAKYTPDQWGSIVVQKCLEYQAAGVIIERNHAGDNPTFVVRACARDVDPDITVRVLRRDEPFPYYTPKMIYVRELVSANPKTTRAAGPAAQTKAGKVHVVGTFDDLERQWTTYVPGLSKSPNNYDAAAQLLSELLELGEERTGQSAQTNVTRTSNAFKAMRDHVARVESATRVGRDARLRIQGRGRMGL